MSKSQTLDIRRLATIALMGALIFVLTALPRIPTPVGGYIHLGDVGITFASLAFGPWVAAIAGGLGTALADVSGGYAQWAIFSLLTHGLQGWAMGVIVRNEESVTQLGLAVVVGILIVTGGYFVAGTILVGLGVAVSEIGFNVVQALSGGLVGVPLYLAVKRAYPPISQYRES